MPTLNYHHLYYFWAATRAGSLSRAARELPLSQPALSLQLRDLERAVGGRLLDRSRSGVTLTPLGRQVFDHCERIFAAGDALARSLSLGAAEPAALRLGSSLSVPREALLRALDAAAGVSRVEIFTGPRAEVRDRLVRHALDAALCDVDLSAGLGDYRGLLIGSFPIRLVAAPRIKARLSRDAAATAPMLMRPLESPARKAIQAFLAARGVRFSLAAETEDSELLRVLALRGRGIAGLSALSCDEDIAAGRLVAVQKSIGARDHVWLMLPARPAASTEARAALERLAALRLPV
jgi:LysR family transcriptional activator of nhaA